MPHLASNPVGTIQCRTKKVVVKKVVVGCLVENSTLDCSSILPQPLLRPTQDFSTLLPYRTPSYIFYPTPIPHPTTPFFVQHWIVQPSHLILPRPTTTFFVLNWIFQPKILPISSQPYHTPGLFSQPTLSYLILPLACSAILPYRTLSCILPHPTLACSSILPHPTTTFFVLHWIVQPEE